MKKALVSSVLILTMLLILSGCPQGGEEEPENIDAYTGSDGLVMAFVPDNPPDTVYLSGNSADVNMIVELWNRGATDISSTYSQGLYGYLYLTGYDPSIINFGITGGPFKTIDNLEGKSDFNPNGGYDTVELYGVVSDLDKGINEYRPNFQLTACYEYETQATPVVCVDPDPYDQIAEKACSPQETPDLASSQGAPVAVTSIRQESSREHVQFEISLQNVGQGRIIESGAVAQICPTQLKYEDLNLVEYEVGLRGNWQEGECKPTFTAYNSYVSSWGNNVNFGTYSNIGGVGTYAGVVRLPDGHGKLFCKFANPANAATGAYRTPLQIHLHYGYTQSINKEIVIKNIDD